MPTGSDIQNFFTEGTLRMARHVQMLCIALFAGLLASLTILPGALVRAQESDSTGARKGTTAGLTTQERAAFIASAKKVAGLNDAQIKRVLENPEMIDDIPVSKKFTSRIVDSPTASSGGTQVRTAIEPVTRRKLATLQYNDANGQLLFKLEATKVWVVDGERVLSGSMNEVTSWVREDARYTPEGGGWRFAEDAESHTDRFVSFDGRAYGGHKSTLATRFDYFEPYATQPIGLVRQGLIQIGHYDGTCDSTSYAPKGGLKITSGPSGYLRSTSASFAFSSAEDAGATFKCRLDGAGFSACSSPKSYVSLAQGEHDFRFHGVDSSGNAMIGAPVRGFTVDSVVPTVSSTTPASGATGVGTGTSVAAVFSEDVEATSLVDDFTLVKAGTTTPVETFITYDPSTRRAVLDPVSNLSPGTRYTATVNGGSGGVTDRAGNLLAADKVWSFTTAG
jgi:hypothetical protein